MTRFEVRTCTSPEDMVAGLAPMLHYFGFAPDAEFSERMSRLLSPERVIAAHVGAQTIGGAAAYAFDLTIPGGRIPVAALTFVAVLPTHRRQGVLRAMMQAHFEACRARGEAVAYLWASEDMIYRRFGFGLASLQAAVEFPIARGRFHSGHRPDGEVRLLPLAEAEPIIAPIYEAVARDTPGMMSRSPPWWQQRVLLDRPWRRQGGGELQCAVFHGASGPEAYALYRLNSRFERGTNAGVVPVVEALGSSPAATAAIWRYLLDIDWLTTLRADLLPLDHPLLLLSAEPRRLNFTLRDGVWVRLVDVAAALSARTYNGGAPVVIEVTDDACPWNADRWRVAPGGTGRTTDRANLRCAVNALGSVFLGGFSWFRLAQAQQVEEVTPGAIARADALFATPRAPWCPEIF